MPAIPEPPSINATRRAGDPVPRNMDSLAGLDSFTGTPKIDAARPSPERPSSLKKAEPPAPTGDTRFNAKPDPVRREEPGKGRAAVPEPLGNFDLPDEQQDEPGSGELAIDPNAEPPAHIKRQLTRQQEIGESIDDKLDELMGGSDDDDNSSSADDDSYKEKAPPQTPPEEGLEEGEVEPEAQAEQDRSDDQIEKEANAYKGPAPLRKAFKQALKREREALKKAKALEEKTASYEAKIKEIESQGIEHPAVKAVIEERDKKIQEREERIRILDYKESEEFQTKYQQPVTKAWERAYADLERMTVSLEDGSERKASEEDFKALLGIRNPAKAEEMAERLFGRFGAKRVMDHRDKVIEATEQRSEALSNAANESKVLLERTVQQQQAARAAAVHKFRSAKAEASKGKYAALFGEIEGDEEGNKLVREYETKFEKLALEPETMSEDERFTTARDLHLMASRYPRALRDLKIAQSKLAEAEKALKGYSRSTPRGGERSEPARNGKPAEGRGMDAAMAALDALPGKRG